VRPNVLSVGEPDASKSAEVVKKALGKHVFDAFIQNKKIEWDMYRTQVTEYERERYLPIL